MKFRVKIEGAYISENPNERTSPDYPIAFDVDTKPNESIGDVARAEGIRIWCEMHGETPEDVHFLYEVI